MSMPTLKSLIVVSTLSVALLIGVIAAPHTTHAASMNTYTKQFTHQLNVRWLNQNHEIRTEADLQSLLEDIIAYLEQRLAQLDGSERTSDITVVTRPAVSIEDTLAVLGGRVTQFHGSDYADVWFEYGRQGRPLVNKTSVGRIDASDDDDSFTATVRDLQEDTGYQFRAVGRDDDGDRDYGAVHTFETSHAPGTVGELPSVTTLAPLSVTNDSVTLRGQVHMHDYDDGRVFFVYGIDDSQVEDVSETYTRFHDVEEAADDLQKILVDSDLDTEATYERRVDDLNADTEYFVSICTEYEDADGDETIRCGGVLAFTTES